MMLGILNIRLFYTAQSILSIQKILLIGYIYKKSIYPFQIFNLYICIHCHTITLIKYKFKFMYKDNATIYYILYYL